MTGMAEMEVVPQEMANPQCMKMFAIERHGFPEGFVLCVERNRRHSYLRPIGRLSGVHL